MNTANGIIYKTGIFVEHFQSGLFEHCVNCFQRIDFQLIVHVNERLAPITAKRPISAARPLCSTEKPLFRDN